MARAAMCMREHACMGVLPACESISSTPERSVPKTGLLPSFANLCRRLTWARSLGPIGLSVHDGCDGAEEEDGDEEAEADAEGG